MFYEQRCSYKLHKIHRKTPLPESFFNKTAGLRPATLLLFFFILAEVLSCEFCEMSTGMLFQNPFGQLLLILFVASFLYFPLSNIFAMKKLASWEKSRLVENRL